MQPADWILLTLTLSDVMLLLNSSICPTRSPPEGPRSFFFRFKVLMLVLRSRAVPRAVIPFGPISAEEGKRRVEESRRNGRRIDSQHYAERC